MTPNIQKKIEEWEIELLKIITEKHGGIGLCDILYNKTIIPYFRQLLLSSLHQIRQETLEEMEEEMKKQKSKVMSRACTNDDAPKKIFESGYSAAILNIINLIKSKIKNL